MDDDHPHKRSMYCDILKIWEQVYPKEQLYIGFFEQIAENPVQLLSEIYTFLGVDNLAPDLYRSTVEQKVNMGVTEVMPIYWRRYLAQRYYDQIECLHARFGNNSTAEWLASAKQAMG
jgi:hypothetical protein